MGKMDSIGLVWREDPLQGKNTGERIYRENGRKNKRGYTAKREPKHKTAELPDHLPIQFCINGSLFCLKDRYADV